MRKTYRLSFRNTVYVLNEARKKIDLKGVLLEESDSRNTKVDFYVNFLLEIS